MQSAINHLQFMPYQTSIQQHVNILFISYAFNSTFVDAF